MAGKNPRQVGEERLQKLLQQRQTLGPDAPPEERQKLDRQIAELVTALEE